MVPLELQLEEGKKNASDRYLWYFCVWSLNSQFRVDLLIPEEDVIGGYSMVSPPHLLAEEGIFQLAIKYHEHPPTFWMSTKAGYMILVEGLA